MENNIYSSKKRLLSLLMTAIFLFVLLTGRLAFVQIIQGKNLTARALDQWTRDVPITPQRGDILDCRGRVVATSYTTYSVYIRAKNVTEPERVAQVLSDITGKSYETVYRKACNRGVSESTVCRQLSAEKATELRDYRLNGVYLAPDCSRFYPYGDLLTQVLGFVSVDNVGQTGLEKQYNTYLAGTPGRILTQTDLIGVELEEEPFYYLPAVNGLQIQLTIDATIQKMTESVLETIAYTHTPKAARAIVMEADTGAILAMASKPSFDLNHLPRDDVASLMEYSRNALLTDVYEPGSTFKVLTAAADLEEYACGNPKAFSPQHIFSDAGYRVVDGRKINCWTKHVNGKHAHENLAMALNNSCNPVFTDIALSLGKETFYKYLDLFGYGKRTGIDFAGEQAGLLVPKNSVKNGDLARIGFGQTIAVTPIQLVSATAAAVNGGRLMTPYLVRSVTTQDGTLVRRFEPQMRNRAVSEETSRTLALMLEDVVTKGSGKQAYIEGYRVGGKTGTAQKYENGVIAQGKYVSSFVGFFPANQPKYVALVVVDEPTGPHYGSTVAAPYAKTIFEGIIRYENIPPMANDEKR